MPERDITTRRRAANSSTPAQGSKPAVACSRRIELTNHQVAKIQVIIGRAVKQRCRHWRWDQKEVITQDTWARLLERLIEFIPDRGSLEAFVETVVPSIISDLKRYARAQKRCPPQLVSLDQPIAGTDIRVGQTITVLNQITLPQGASLNGELQPLRLDISKTVSGLNERDRDMAEGVMTRTVTDYARSSGIPRSTVRYRLAATRTRARKASLQEYLNRPVKR